MHNTIPLECKLNKASSELYYLVLTVPASIVDTLYDAISYVQQKQVSVRGFENQSAPLGYIQEYYRAHLLEHVAEFLFKYCIINHLFDVLLKTKICCASEPRLYESVIEPHQDAQFTFELSIAHPIEFKEWKNFPFKAPKRKNYKDIDRQVELFLKEEVEQVAQSQDYICIGDWVKFDIALLDSHCKECLPLSETVWLKIGNEFSDMSFQELLLGKKEGESFVANNTCLQEYFSHTIVPDYSFKITIKNIVSSSCFSLEDFKYHFKLRSAKDVHQKLIEIFSYRNDMSQRRGMVEEAFKLMVSKHHIQVPNYLILRQQKNILDALQRNPDYQVYKMEPSFKETVRLLATKQVKEMLLIDQLIFHEKIAINDQDIIAYLNCLKRPRTREFIYFMPPETKVDGQEQPIPEAFINRCCLREKALNHVIWHLTKR